ncbi:hypothetical protein chiPu_0014077 [Chiloscyllium punctatum]|uniref:Uncharacterized protein n=1 Tax=Chiloscyllium punctatum TaxID=137246 RepID=A0A401SYW1_CHIPU|nr:hypothetical protein [Chiloscyllium punctatum]
MIPERGCDPHRSSQSQRHRQRQSKTFSRLLPFGPGAGDCLLQEAERHSAASEERCWRGEEETCLIL